MRVVPVRHDTMATTATTTCGLFLTGKDEETPKKCRDLIKTVRTLANDHQFSSFGQVESCTALLLSRPDSPHGCVMCPGPLGGGGKSW